MGEKGGTWVLEGPVGQGLVSVTLKEGMASLPLTAPHSRASSRGLGPPWGIPSPAVPSFQLPRSFLPSCLSFLPSCLPKRPAMNKPPLPLGLRLPPIE